MIQFCFLLVLSLFVKDKEAVFAASIYYHMAQWIPVTAIGMLYFLGQGSKLPTFRMRRNRSTRKSRSVRRRFSRARLVGQSRPSRFCPVSLHRQGWHLQVLECGVFRFGCMVPEPHRRGSLFPGCRRFSVGTKGGCET